MTQYFFIFIVILQHKYNNKSNVIFMGFDSIEINIFYLLLGLIITQTCRGFQQDCPAGRLTKVKVLEMFSMILPEGNAAVLVDQIFRIFDKDGDGSINFTVSTIVDLLSRLSITNKLMNFFRNHALAPTPQSIFLRIIQKRILKIETRCKSKSHQATQLRFQYYISKLGGEGGGVKACTDNADAGGWGSKILGNLLTYYLNTP